jgi:hypothetical protein
MNDVKNAIENARLLRLRIGGRLDPVESETEDAEILEILREMRDRSAQGMRAAAKIVAMGLNPTAVISVCPEVLNDD